MKEEVSHCIRWLIKLWGWIKGRLGQFPEERVVVVEAPYSQNRCVFLKWYYIQVLPDKENFGFCKNLQKTDYLVLQLSLISWFRASFQLNFKMLFSWNYTSNWVHFSSTESCGKASMIPECVLDKLVVAIRALVCQIICIWDVAYSLWERKYDWNSWC